MDPAIVLSISLGAIVVIMTVVSIYTAFGPPAQELTDPFDDHED